MPYGFVLIKEIPEHWDKVREMLIEYTDVEKKMETLRSTGAVLLSWYKCFGWADFIAVVWSPNIECIKTWITKFRDDVKSTVDNKSAPLTTTIIGIHEKEESKELEVRLFENLIKQYSKEDDYKDKIISEFNVARFKAFLDEHKKDVEEILNILYKKCK